MKKQILLIIFFLSAVCDVNAQVEKKIIEGTLAENTQIAKKNIVDKYAKVGGVNYTQATNVAVYDFTTGDGSQFHGGASAAKLLPDGKWAMIAGNGNPETDNVIDVTDYGVVYSQFFETGYKIGDYNLDGVADISDYYFVYSNFFRTSMVP